IRVDVDERREEVVVDETVVAARGENGIERGDVGLEPADECAAFLRRVLVGGVGGSLLRRMFLLRRAGERQEYRGDGEEGPLHCEQSNACTSLLPRRGR